MTWLQRYRLHHYVANSIWIMPAAGAAVALVVVRLLHGLETALGWEAGISPDTARLVVGTMASSMFTFVVFVSSAMLVVVQLASAQLTPRIIGIVFRDPVTRFSLTVFVFTFTFSVAVLVRVNDVVPALTVSVSAYSCVASLGVFLFMLDHVGKALRPSGALRTVSRLGRDVIQHVYPKQLADIPSSADDRATSIAGPPTRVVTNLEDGVVLAFNIDGLVAMAVRCDCIVEMVPQVGDSIVPGDPLFRIHHGGNGLTDEALRQSVAVGQERTIEQDPALAFRIMVDIASKGLSPAINDPTTAVLAIDQVHHLLRLVGRRQLDDERVRDAGGKVRLVYRTPAWEDFVHLAVTEIRYFGGESIQIARRLRAMLENLIATLPPERVPLLQQELHLLERSAERFFPEPEDRALAEVSDFQGVGSNCSSPANGHRTNSTG